MSAVLAELSRTQEQLLGYGPMVLLAITFIVWIFVAVGEYPEPGRRSQRVGLVVLALVLLLIWDITHWPVTPNS
jgi:hypothetical protein